MVDLLMLVSIVVGLGGALFLSEATTGVGVIAIGALFGIWARIAQARRQHDAIMAAIEKKNE